MTTPNAKPRAGEHTDRFWLPEASYQDAMEMGNSLARAVVAQPEDFGFDERVLCRAFCLSAKEEILATQRWDTAAAERDALAASNAELLEALQQCYHHLGWRPSKIPADVADNTRALLAKYGR